MIDPARSFDDLIRSLDQPPRARVAAAASCRRYGEDRQQQQRLLIPTVLLNGFQTPKELLQGGAPIGPNNTMNLWELPRRFSLQPLWQLEAIGLGNMASQGERGKQSLAIIDLRLQDMVAADVTRTLAAFIGGSASQPGQPITAPHHHVNGNFEGLPQTTRFGNVLALVNRPQEAVFALQLLNWRSTNTSRRSPNTTGRSSSLFHALGYPASEIAYLQPPGDVPPVDTRRPDYMPPVGEGPPPATR